MVGDGCARQVLEVSPLKLAHRLRAKRDNTWRSLQLDPALQRGEGERVHDRGVPDPQLEPTPVEEARDIGSGARRQLLHPQDGLPDGEVPAPVGRRVLTQAAQPACR